MTLYRGRDGRMGGVPLDPYNDLRAPFPEMVDELQDGEDAYSRSIEFDHVDRWQRLGDIARRLVEDLQVHRGD